MKRNIDKFRYWRNRYENAVHGDVHPNVVRVYQMRMRFYEPRPRNRRRR